MQFITNEHGKFVIPTITDTTDSLSPPELAVRNKVTEHLGFVVIKSSHELLSGIHGAGTKQGP